MATKVGIDEGEWFIGADTSLEFTVYADADTILDVSTYALSYVLKKGNNDADALITKTSGMGGGITVTGAFNADPDVNTQRVVVTITDEDTDGFKAGNYQHALARTDSGSETVLLYSDEDTPVVLTKAAI